MLNYNMHQELNTNNYIIFDFETTGFSNNSEIIEYAFLYFENNKLVSELTSFVKPRNLIPYNITRITGISDYMVKNESYIENHIDQIAQFINNKTIIAHNINFDLRFLTKILNNKDNINVNCIDSVILLKKYLPKQSSYSLDNLKQAYQIYMDNHRAKNDCLIVQRLLEIAFNK